MRSTYFEVLTWLVRNESVQVFATTKKLYAFNAVIVLGVSVDVAAASSVGISGRVLIGSLGCGSSKAMGK